MDNLCRLCAVEKSPDELLYSIDDEALNIEQKLIDCCRWNAFSGDDNEGMPKMICDVCYQRLETSWEFAESVEQAQRKFYVQSIEMKPLILLQIERLDAPLTDEQRGIKEEIHEYLDSEHSMLDNESSVDELMTQQDIDDTFNAPKYEVDEEDEDEENEENQNNAENIEQFIKKPNKTIRRNGAVTKIKKQKENQTTKDNFDFLASLSTSDKNADGSVTKEKIDDLNLDDWSILKMFCFVCNQVFDKYRTLKSHFERLHPKKRLMLQCTLCNAMYAKKWAIHKHVINNHRPYLKFCCKKCNVFYWDLNALKKHMSGSHTSQQTMLDYLCEICGKHFTNKSLLKHHTHLHVPIEQRRTFECYLCNSYFAYKKSLIHHMSTHSGMKILHQCHVCESQFSRSDALQRHLLIHLGKLPHKCQNCGKSFRTKFNLRVHERIHTGERPYPCMYCAYRATDGPNLGKHIKLKHKNEPNGHFISVDELDDENI